MTRIRKSVPTEGMHEWWLLGWQYIMPDFTNRNCSIIEWSGSGNPLEPDSSNRVSETMSQEDADDRTDNRAQQRS